VVFFDNTLLQSSRNCISAVWWSDSPDGHDPNLTDDRG
jgi:hypothetical protein